MNMARRNFLFLAVFCVFLSIFVNVKCSLLDQTLHIYKDGTQERQTRRTFVFNAGEEIPSYHDQQKRSATPPETPNFTPKIDVKVRILITFLLRGKYNKNIRNFHLIIFVT